MDYECRKDHAEIEFKDIMDFLIIKRHESLLSAFKFLQRFNMAKGKCMYRHRRAGPLFSDRAITSLTLETAALPAQDRKVVLCTANGGLSQTENTAYHLRNIVGATHVSKEAHFVDENDQQDNKKPKSSKSEKPKNRSGNGKKAFPNLESGYDADSVDLDVAQEAWVLLNDKKQKWQKQQKIYAKSEKKKGK